MACDIMLCPAHSACMMHGRERGIGNREREYMYTTLNLPLLHVQCHIYIHTHRSLSQSILLRLDIVNTTAKNTYI